MAQQLFNEIVEFLARGTKQGSPEGPHDLAGRGGATVPPLTLASPTPPCHGPHVQLLPICTMGKGERSPHFELHCYLGQKGYCVISEFPLHGRGTVDCIVFRNQAPVAVIELKSHSVHQPKGMAALLSGLASDYQKRSGQALRLPGNQCIVNDIPLIQIGLLVAVFDFGKPPVSTPKVPPNHPVAFISRYICGHAPSQGVINNPASTTSDRNYKNAHLIVSPWFSYGSQYRQGRWGWGPLENYSLSGGTPKDFPVIGRVGFVCVMSVQ